MPWEFDRMTPGQTYDVLRARGLLQLRGAGRGVSTAEREAAFDALWDQIQQAKDNH